MKIIITIPEKVYEVDKEYIEFAKKKFYRRLPKGTIIKEVDEGMCELQKVRCL